MSNLYTATVFIRYLLDISTFWTQLLISLAVALERFVNISLGAEANQLMSSSRRKKFYAAISIACLFVPFVIFLDFVINMEQVNSKLGKLFDALLKYYGLIQLMFEVEFDYYFGFWDVLTISVFI